MWIKNFRHKKLQSFVMVLIILLCSLMLTTSASILTALEQPFQKLASECESATMMVYPYAMDAESINKLGNEFLDLKDVKDVEYVNAYSISNQITYKGENTNSFTFLSEYNEKVFGNIRYLEGSTETSLNLKNNECIIPACLSVKYNIKMGDDISIKLMNDEQRYIVRGIYAEIYDSSTAYNNNIIIKKLPENINAYRIIYIYGKNNVNGATIEEEYREAYDGQLLGSTRTKEDTISNTLLAVNIVGGILLAIGFITLMVSCLIINFMMRNTMIIDAKKIAIYKTMGYSNHSILKIYITFYFVIAALSSGLGIGISKILTDKIMASMFESIGEQANTNVLISGIGCFILIVGMVVGIIYSILGKMKSVKPVYALNGMESSNTNKKNTYQGNLNFQFSSFGIAMRNLTRDKKGAISILVTATVCTFAINFAIISLDVANNMRENNSYWLGLDSSDVMGSLSKDVDWEESKLILEADNRVTKVIPSNLHMRNTMKWEKGIKNTEMNAFVYEDYQSVNLELIDGYNPRKSDEIAISTGIADDLKKEMGDYITVYLNGKTPVSLLVTGIYQTYYEMGRHCRLLKATYEENNIEFEYDTLSIYLKENVDKEQFIEDMTQKLGNSSKLFKRSDAYASIMDMIMDPQQKAIPPITVLTLMIGAINIFCIVLLKNANNKNANSIYKSIGYSTNHLIISNIWYVLILSIVSSVIAIPAVMVTYTPIMQLSLSMFGMREYTPEYNLVHIIGVNLCIVVVFILGSIASSQSLRRVNVRDLVQE